VCVAPVDTVTRPLKFLAVDAVAGHSGAVVLALDWCRVHGKLVTAGEDCRRAAVPWQLMHCCLLAAHSERLSASKMLRSGCPCCLSRAAGSKQDVSFRVAHAAVHFAAAS
jgi:hypothetical protein